MAARLRHNSVERRPIASASLGAGCGLRHHTHTAACEHVRPGAERRGSPPHFNATYAWLVRQRCDAVTQLDVGALTILSLTASPLIRLPRLVIVGVVGVGGVAVVPIKCL